MGVDPTGGVTQWDGPPPQNKNIKRVLAGIMTSLATLNACGRYAGTITAGLVRPWRVGHSLDRARRQGGDSA